MFSMRVNMKTLRRLILIYKHLHPAQRNKGDFILVVNSIGRLFYEEHLW